MDVMRPPAAVRAGKAVFSVTSQWPDTSLQPLAQIRTKFAKNISRNWPNRCADPIAPLHSTAGVDGIGGKSHVRTFLFWANGWFLGETGVDANGNYPLMSW